MKFFALVCSCAEGKTDPHPLLMTSTEGIEVLRVFRSTQQAELVATDIRSNRNEQPLVREFEIKAL